MVSADILPMAGDKEDQVMWTIGQLKARGKSCFQRNYWKAVLIALVISLIGGMQGSKAVQSVFVMGINIISEIGNTGGHANDFRAPERGFENNPFSDDNDFDIDFGEEFGNDYISPYGQYNYPGSSSSNPFSGFSSGMSTAMVGMIVIVAMLAFLLVLVLMIVGILIDIFLKNPLFIGTQRFFIHNLTENGMVGDMGFGFDRNYKNQVRIMFFRDLYTLGWSCLFLIPGIYKSYEYRMIPYLLAEYPQMDKEQAFYTSRFLMQGNKGRAFLLDLSFIGWWLLSGITVGLVGVFYVNPYYVSTCAALYEALKAIKGIPAYRQEQMQFDPQTGEPVYAGAQGEYFSPQSSESDIAAEQGEAAGANTASNDGIFNQDTAGEVAGDNFVMRSSAESVNESTQDSGQGEGL